MSAPDAPLAAAGGDAPLADVPGGAPLSSQTRLALPRGTRLHHCAVRGRWTLLVPEKVLFPCPITTDVLGRLDGETSLGTLAGEMAREYEAPVELVLHDIAELMSDLVGRGYVRRAHA